MQLNLEEGKVNEVAYYLRDTGGENFVLVHFVRSRQSKLLISNAASDFELELVTTVLIGTIRALNRFLPHRLQSLIQSRREHNFGRNHSLERVDILRATFLYNSS